MKKIKYSFVIILVLCACIISSSLLIIGDNKNEVYANKGKTFASEPPSMLSQAMLNMENGATFCESSVLIVLDEDKNDLSTIIANSSFNNREDFFEMRNLLDNIACGVYSLQISDIGRESVLNAIIELESAPGIRYVEPNYYFFPGAISRDPYFNSMWGLNGTHGIRASQAWWIATGSSNIRVGVIDSGIARHANLNANLLPGRNFYPSANAIQRLNTHDTDGHGTHVAGTIGAVGNNGIGTTGVAWNVGLVPMKVDIPNDPQRRWSGQAVINAINHATNLWNTTQRIHILNFSGWNFSNSNILRSSIANFPGLFICIAGNGNGTNINLDASPNFPGSFNISNSITVGSINSSGYRSSFSNFGSTAVHVFAPGNSIKSTLHGNSIIGRTSGLPANAQHTHLSGTSMAAPHVAGIAALMMSANISLKSQPALVKQIIMETVDMNNNLRNISVSGGRVNAHSALLRAVNPILVRTQEDLNKLRTMPTEHFKLANNISLFGNWTPIPNFHGILDGNGFTISNMFINLTGTTLDNYLNLGFFATLNGIVTNLTISQSSIFVSSNHAGNGWINAGILSGVLLNNGTARNVTSTTNEIAIHRENSRAGGIIGNSYGLIQYSTARNISFNGNSDMGGIVGSTRSGSVTTGNVFVSHTSSFMQHWFRERRSLGGVAGLQGAGSTISNNWVDGLVIYIRNYGTPNIGTIVGHARETRAIFFFGNSSSAASVSTICANGIRSWDNDFSIQRGRVDG